MITLVVLNISLFVWVAESKICFAPAICDKVPQWIEITPAGQCENFQNNKEIEELYVRKERVQKEVSRLQAFAYKTLACKTPSSCENTATTNRVTEVATSSGSDVSTTIETRGSVVPTSDNYIDSTTPATSSKHVNQKLVTPGTTSTGETRSSGVTASKKHRIPTTGATSTKNAEQSLTTASTVVSTTPEKSDNNTTGPTSTITAEQSLTTASTVVSTTPEKSDNNTTGPTSTITAEQGLTTASTPVASTAPETRTSLPKSCITICSGISKGTIADKPVGLSTSGSTAIIYPDFQPRGVGVYCDCTNGPSKAWTVFQRRMDGSVDFLQNWNEYVTGFGNPLGEFWLGLENIHSFTGGGGYELKIDLKDFEGHQSYAKYSSFSVGGRSTNYRLSVDGYNGTAGDSLINSPSDFVNNNMPFTTIDRDNDFHTKQNCADWRKGAWWFNKCMYAHLNGKYYARGQSHRKWQGIIWKTWRGGSYSLAAAEMRFRKKLGT